MAGLEEEALLRVHDCGFAGIDVKEGGVEVFRSVQHAATGDVVGVEFVFFGGNFFEGDGGDGFASGGEVVPEGSYCVSAGKTTGHANDGDAFGRGGGVGGDGDHGGQFSVFQFSVGI